MNQNFYFFPSISSERFQEIADELGAIFSLPGKPSKTALFYYPRECASNGLGAVEAGGVLYSKYCHERKDLIKWKLLEKHQRSSQGI